jgi:hypothetical protein
MTMLKDIDTPFAGFKVLPTAYEGYAFRSRLSARWAVFFDALGVEWQYDVEGFLTRKGQFQPDFNLPKYRTWVSVQQRGFAHWDSREWLSGRDIAIAQRTSFMLVIGDPMDVIKSVVSDPELQRFSGGALCHYKDATTEGIGALELTSFLHFDARDQVTNAAEKARSARFSSDPA